MTPRFFLPSPLAVGREVALPPNAAHHVSAVLRLRPGDAVTLFDGSGGEYGARIERMTSRAVDVVVGEHRASERESPLSVTLVQAVIAAERMDYVIQKSVELGVSEIAPVTCARGVTRLDASRAERRAEHWRQIAIASCEQCGRNRLPGVHAPADLTTWLRRASAAGARLLLAPAAQTTLGSIGAPANGIELLVGPEGGLTPDEEAAALAAGFNAIRVGPRVLRTETAGPAMLAAMNALWGDWR
jgi:16S rRNA (uracil1498-N3)-methyltransferase